MTPIILGLETSTDACSVALSTAQQTFTEYVVEPQAHSKLMLGMVESVCKQAGISLNQVHAFAFGKGPGSFTGLRIAASVVQGLAFGVNKPVIAVSSLQALAQQAANLAPTATILATLDARMQEIYYGLYACAQDSLVKAKMTDCLQKPEQLNSQEATNCLAVGTGCAAYAALLQAKYPQMRIDINILYPRAQEVVQLAIAQYLRSDTLSASAAVPVYIRNDVVQTGKKNPG